MPTLPTAAAASTYGRISVSGSDFLIDNTVTSQHFFGVVDTTALQYAILAYVNGQTQYAGKTSVFNGPDTSNLGTISQNANPTVFWSQYFGLLQYYGCNLVRIGAGDTWGTGLQYDAWTNHHDAYLSLLNTMLDEAEVHQVWVVLVLAGSQEYPTYQFGGSGSVFQPGTSACNNYIAYSRAVMSALDGQTGLGWFDMFNEPDHNYCYNNYWSTNGGQTAFHNWACAVASGTAGASTHPRSMGTAEVDLLFGMNKADFDLATGTVPFEIADIHYYASNTDNNNFALPEGWAAADGKPLFWSELGYNAVYPLTRYTFGENAIWSNGGQAITSMVLTGTPGYPYTGGTLPQPGSCQVSQITPANGATSVGVDTTIIVVFSASMNTASVQSAYSLRSTATVAGTTVWSDSNKRMTFTPTSTLAQATKYTVSISTSAKDAQGNALTSTYSSSFTTAGQVPGAPLSVSSTGGTGGITVTWSAPSSNGGASITGYNLYRASSSGAEGSTPFTRLGNVQSFTDQGLPGGTTYYYKLSAVNSAGEGALSAETSATTNSVPGQPTSLTATGGSRSTALQWVAPASNGGSPVTSYRIYRGASSGSETFLTSAGAVTSFIDGGLANATTYFYRVSAVNAVGEGTKSQEATTRTAVLVPAAPTQLSATAGDGQVTLTWAAPSSDGGGAVTGYRIFRGTVSGGESQIASVGLTTSYLDQAVQDNLTYYYQVAAVNAVGQGAMSSEVHATLSHLPSAPSDLASRTNNSVVSLSWAKPYEDGGFVVTLYRIYRGSAPSQLILIGTSTFAWFNDTSFSPTMTYYYSVSAINANGEGPMCAPITVVTSAHPPDAPTIVSATAGDGSAHIEWSEPSDGGAPILNYDVQRATSDGVYSSIAHASSSSYDDLTVENGQTYSYRIGAINSAGEGNLSQTVYLTPMTTPGAPASLTLVPGDSNIHLSWERPLSDGGSGITSYLVYKGTSPSSLILFAEITSNSTSDTDVKNEVEYFYAVAAENAVGAGPLSSVCACTPGTVPCAPTGLTAVLVGSSISLNFSEPSSAGSSPVTAYRILRGDSPGNETAYAETTTTTYSDIDVLPGVTYYYQVVAVNAVGASAPSSEVLVNVADLLDSPHLSAKYSNGAVELTWTAPELAGVTGYAIYRGSSPDSMVRIATIDTVTVYTDSQVETGETYYYQVSAIDSKGEGRCSPALEVQCISGTLVHSSSPRPAALVQTLQDSPSWMALAIVAFLLTALVVVLSRIAIHRDWRGTRHLRGRVSNLLGRRAR